MQRWRTFFGSNVPGYRKRKQHARGNAILGLLGGFLVSYIISEVGLEFTPHPLHWVAAGVGAVAIYLVTYLWLLRRSYTQQINKKTHG
jgi:ABC-type antimicrobial peptide transport system permease subunit